MRRELRSWLWLPMLFALCAQAHAAAPGTSITDTATAGYQDASSNTYSATSNTVTTVVANTPSLSVVAGAGQNVTAGMIAVDTFTLTNTGNAAGTFALSGAATFGGTSSGATLQGYVLNAASTGTCSVATPCTLSALGTQLSALSAAAVNGTISIGVEYQVGTTSSVGQTAQTTLSANITYAAAGSVAAATSGNITGTSTDTLVADARIDLQTVATQPSSSGANITWTVTANNGGAYAAGDSLAVGSVLGVSGNGGILISVLLPTFGGPSLALQSTPTCALSGASSGATATLYYSTGSGWSATVPSPLSNAVWVGCFIHGGSGSELPSAPSQSSGAGSVTTPQATLTFVTAQPSGVGASTANAVGATANAAWGGQVWANGSKALLGPTIALGTADSGSYNLATQEANTTASSGAAPPGGASNVAHSQAYAVEPRIDIQETASQPSSSGAAITWTVTANDGGNGAAYSTAAMSAAVNIGDSAIAFFIKSPTYGGTPLGFTGTPTCALSSNVSNQNTSTPCYFLYSTASGVPAAYSGNTSCSTRWCSTYNASSTWLAVVVESNNTSSVSMLASEPSNSGGAGSVTTAEVTVTFSTNQPSGSGSTTSGSVTNMTNAVVDDASGTIIGPGIASASADSGNGVTAAAYESDAATNTTPSSGVTAPGGASNQASSQAYSAAPRLDVQETASAPASSGASIAWTITANNGGNGAAYGSNVCYWGTQNATEPLGVCILLKLPAYGGSPLGMKAAPTVTLSGLSGDSYSVMYSTSSSAPSSYSPWSSSYTANAVWLVVYVWNTADSNGACTHTVLPSAPSQSGGAGNVSTAQITVTFNTNQPSGSGSASTGSVTNMANSLVSASTGGNGTLYGQGLALGNADTSNSTTVATYIQGIENNTTPSSGMVAPGGASNIASSQAYITDYIFTGPYNLPQATGSYPAAPNNGAAAASNTGDFTAITVPCTSTGGSINNGSTCTVGTNVTIINTVQNTNTSSDTVTLSAQAPAGWTVQLYNASSCSGGGSTWPACTQGSSIAGPSTAGGIASGTVSIGASSSVQYEAVYNATSNTATPFTAADAVITATGAAGGVNTNTTHNDLYPGGALQLSQTVTVTSTNCPSGMSPSNSGACPGGTLQYALTYTNITPAASTVANVGTEPAFAYNALSGALVITADGTASNNAWATYSFGLNAAPSDTTSGTTYSYSGASGFASGTYPSITGGYTKFIATVGGSSYKVGAGASGTITYTVTVK